MGRHTPKKNCPAPKTGGSAGSVEGTSGTEKDEGGSTLITNEGIARWRAAYTKIAFLDYTKGQSNSGGFQNTLPSCPPILEQVPFGRGATKKSRAGNNTLIEKAAENKEEEDDCMSVDSKE